MVKPKKPALLNNHKTSENLCKSYLCYEKHPYPACDVQDGVFDTLKGEAIYLQY